LEFLVIFRNTTGRIEMIGLERSHKRPAPAETVFDDAVDVFRRDIAAIYQMQRLIDERELQAVQHIAEDFLIQPHRHLANTAEERAAGVERCLAGRRPEHYFHHGNEMRWVDRMGDACCARRR